MNWDGKDREKREIKLNRDYLVTSEWWGWICKYIKFIFLNRNNNIPTQNWNLFDLISVFEGKLNFVYKYNKRSKYNGTHIHTHINIYNHILCHFICYREFNINYGIKSTSCKWDFISLSLNLSLTLFLILRLKPYSLLCLVCNAK